MKIKTSFVEKISGSLSTKIKETDHKKARKKAGKLLLKKYNIK